MDIINRKKSRRKLRQKEKKYFSRLNGQAKLIYKKYRNNKFSVNENKGKIRKLTKEYITEPSFMIQLPKKFSIYDQSNCRSVIRVCNLITKKHNRIFIDLSDAETLAAAACGLLMSSVYKSLSMGNVIKCNYPKNEKASAVLQKIGFFSAVGKKQPLKIKVMDSYPDVACWYVYKGDAWDSQEIHNAVHEFTINHVKQKKSIFTISHKNNRNIEIKIKEIIGNVVEHAYPESYPFDKKWILFARYNIEKNELVIVISDSGATIPVTFMRYHKDKPNFQDLIKSALRKDSRLIKLAVKESESGTRKPGRGNGLRWVEDTVQGFGGALVIYSRNGCYVSSGTTVFILPIKLPQKISGTIVNIILPLSSLK